MIGAFGGLGPIIFNPILGQQAEEGNWFKIWLISTVFGMGLTLFTTLYYLLDFKMIHRPKLNVGLRPIPSESDPSSPNQNLSVQ